MARDAARPDDVVMIGECALMCAVRKRIGRFASWPDPVLVLGETGAGKELVARALHTDSRRHAGPFLAVNCAATSSHLFESECFGHERGAYTDAHAATPGWFGAAEGGTLFFDEIGELPLALQPKLLRAIETREVLRVGAGQPRRTDVRVIAATNADLAAAGAGREFRADLYHRLSVLTIDLPPLRARGPADLRRLAEYYLPRIAAERSLAIPTIDDEAMAMLIAYDWPGNVRELINGLKSATASTPDGTITVFDLPEAVRAGADHLLRRVAVAPKEGHTPLGLDVRLATHALERRLMAAAPERTGGRVKESAALTHIPERTFRRKMLAYGLARRSPPS